jgi:hypothetical protein
MVLQQFFTEREIELIIEAVEAQETKWRAVANRPIQGYGNAKEQTKKEARMKLADEHLELLQKITEHTI